MPLSLKDVGEKTFFGAEHIDFFAVKKYGRWGLMNAEFDHIMPIDGSAT